MKSKIISILKIALPIVIAIYIVWYFNQSLTSEDKENIWTSFKQANYFWIIVSLLLGWLSHVVRAYRWLYMLEPLGGKPKFWNSYHAVMIGYIINISLPRAGEAARAAYFSKYSDIPFEKTFGTILAERVVDLIFLLSISLMAVYMQLDKLEEFQSLIMQVNTGGETEDTIPYFKILFVIAAISGGLLYVFNLKLRKKINTLLFGLIEGLKSIFKIKKKWNYLFHTTLIWVFYIAMFYVCYWSIPETSNLSLNAIMAGFVAGSFGIVLVQGGIGVYPLLVAITVTLYLGVPENSNFVFNQHGYALGWLIWVSQTIMIVVLGILSLLLMPKINKNTDAS